MKKSIWRFSIGGLLVFTAVVAGVVAFAANYPAIAFLVACGAAWLLVESQVLFNIQAGDELTKPSWSTRHPFIVAGLCLFVGAVALFFCVGGWYMIWTNPSPNWWGLIPVAFFGIIGIFSLRPIWLLARYDQKADEVPHPEDD
jgi:hypothetical protein